MRAELIYAALLRCYPAAFRDEYGDEMRLTFTEQLGEARQTGRRAQAAVWAQAASDALVIAPKEHWHVLVQDLRYALRTLAGSRTFAIVAILSLALGIGANTAVFSVWNGLLRAPLPVVHEPSQLVMLTDPGAIGMWLGRAEGVREWVTYDEFEQLRDRAEGFTALMASQSSLNTWQVRAGSHAWEEARGRLVSGEFFDVLGVRAALGRAFTSADDHAATPHAVISDSYWRRRFGSRPDALGTTLTVREVPLTIVGVMPPGFIGESGGQQPDFWLPLQLQPIVQPGSDWLHDAPPDKLMWLHVFGRLKPGVTAARAEAQANSVFRAGLETFYGVTPSTPRGQEFLNQRLAISPGARGAASLANEFSSSLTTLFAAVGVLLLIACANLANLLLARGTARALEVAVRLSLGASRGRLVRQLITESLVLAVAGGVGAVAVGYMAHGALVRMLAQSEPRLHMPFVVDATMLGFVLAATLVAALVFGVLPALHLASSGASLRDRSRGTIGSSRRPRVSGWLVGLQLALSVPLLVCAGLLARTVYNLQRVDVGFATERLLLARVDLGETSRDVPRRDRALRELRASLQRVPGVSAATFSQLGLFTGGFSSSTIEVEGFAPSSDADRDSMLDRVGPRYFATLGIALRLGRDITEDDGRESPRVCVVNDAFARKYFAGRNPLGMRITTVDDEAQTDYQVVGVAADARTRSLRDEIEPRFFVPAEQRPSSGGNRTFLIRTAGVSTAVMAQVREMAGHVDPELTVTSLHSLEEQMAPLTAQDRATAQLAVVFGIVALSLAAMGLYGLLSYGIARRTGEIALRIALGAYPRRVVAMILRESMTLVGAGLLAGSALAYAATRFLDAQLYGVAPQDSITFVVAIGVLLLAAMGATCLPARRASKLDPMRALNC
jgi:predicted permease